MHVERAVPLDTLLAIRTGDRLRWTIVVVLLDAIDHRAVHADAARRPRTAKAAEARICRVLWAAVDVVCALNRVATAWVYLTPAAMSGIRPTKHIH